MQYIRSLINGPDFLCRYLFCTNTHRVLTSIDATVDVALWSTVEPGIGITAGCLATLRPLLQRILLGTGLAAAPPRARQYRSYQSELSRQKRNRRRGYSNSIEAHDLVPTSGSTSTTISGPNQSKKFWIGNRSLDAMEATNAEPTGIQQSVVVRQEITGPPRLHLRESLRHSFTRGTVLSSSKKSSSLARAT